MIIKLFVIYLSLLPGEMKMNAAADGGGEGVAGGGTPNNFGRSKKGQGELDLPIIIKGEGVCLCYSHFICMLLSLSLCSLHCSSPYTTSRESISIISGF